MKFISETSLVEKNYRVLLKKNGTKSTDPSKFMRLNAKKITRVY
jgi:hypothetical protein